MNSWHFIEADGQKKFACILIFYTNIKACSETYTISSSITTKRNKGSSEKWLILELGWEYIIQESEYPKTDEYMLKTQEPA